VHSNKEVTTIIAHFVSWKTYRRRWMHSKNIRVCSALYK